MVRRLPVAGFVLCCPFLAAQAVPRPTAEQVFVKLAAQYDKDKDGSITAQEYPRGGTAFRNLDRNGDGVITRADFERRGRRARGGEGGRGARPPAARRAAEQVPKVGELAPDFALPMLGMKDTVVQLSSFRGKQPVALIFGSYT